MKRRTFVRSSLVVGTAGVAGCLSADDESGGNGTDDTDDEPEGFEIPRSAIDLEDAVLDTVNLSDRDWTVDDEETGEEDELGPYFQRTFTRRERGEDVFLSSQAYHPASRSDAETGVDSAAEEFEEIGEAARHEIGDGGLGFEGGTRMAVIFCVDPIVGGVAYEASDSDVIRLDDGYDFARKQADKIERALDRAV